MTIAHLPDLHDSGLTAFHLDFQNNTGYFRIEIYSDEKKDFDSIKIVFAGIHSIECDNFAFSGDFSDFEINSFAIKEIDKLIEASIVMLQGFGKPSSTILITAEKVTFNSGKPE